MLVLKSPNYGTVLQVASQQKREENLAYKTSLLNNHLAAPERIADYKVYRERQTDRIKTKRSLTQNIPNSLCLYCSLVHMSRTEAFLTVRSLRPDLEGGIKGFAYYLTEIIASPSY